MNESAAEARDTERAQAADLLKRYHEANQGAEGEETDTLLERGHAERTPDGIRLTNDGHRVMRQYADIFPDLYRQVNPRSTIERSDAHG